MKFMLILSCEQFPVASKFVKNLLASIYQFLLNPREEKENYLVFLKGF
jgi:hypothetical protein